jgi:hypothetical protein
MKNILVYLFALLFTVSVSAQTPAPKKEEPKKEPVKECVEKDKNGKAILGKDGKPVVCPKVEQKKDEKKK